jgi:RHS repeat-associated protein
MIVAPNSGGNQVEHIYFPALSGAEGNGQRIARRSQTSQVNSSVYYFFSDHLGTTRIVTDSAGTVVEDSDFYAFGGERVVLDGLNNNYKFAGKERDPESGLDNFIARYNASTLGRFMSPDPLGGRRLDPQTLNKYSYVRNNPLNLIDPTGMYICQGTTEQCNNFEESRQQNLKSKVDDVVRGAKAYGDPTKDNGVTVKFGDPGEGNNGITAHNIETDLGNPNGMRAQETVTIREGLSGSDLTDAVAHEGSHVADAQEFVASITPTDADYSKNLTKYQTEMRAYLVTHAVRAAGNQTKSFDCGLEACQLGARVANPRQQIERILARPPYNVTPQNQGSRLYPAFDPPPTATTPR